jgi:hypothetical protein
VTTLPAIDVSRSDMLARLESLRRGLTLDEVRRLLGGQEFKTEPRAEGDVDLVHYWRFRLTDGATPAEEYEIYSADFVGDRFQSGILLPQG